MNQDQFWSMIDLARHESSGDPIKQAELLVEALTEMPEQEIFDYQKIFDEFNDHAYLADLWDAAAILDSWGCSDDGFTDFRAWLIGQGKTVYQNILANPENLADTISPGDETQIEELCYVAGRAYRNKTGLDLIKIPQYDHTPPQLKGSKALDRIGAKNKFPRLSAIFKDDAER